MPVANMEDSSHPSIAPPAAWLLVLAAAAIPASLLWDFSWESTVGIDLVWAPPHLMTYCAVALAAFTALKLAFATPRYSGVVLGKLSAPLGAWVVLWGAFAFVAAVLFDRWWQAGYGLAAGIWHPPQILKATAFFAILAGAWFGSLTLQRRGGVLGFAIAGGMLLAMIAVATIVSAYPNRQHAASFYQLACGTYPVVLVAAAVAGGARFSATATALAYTALQAGALWLLPLVPAQPQVAPIYNPHDHLMPPPFPLLLIVPAFAVDLLLRVFPGREQRFEDWRRAGELGLAFFLTFTAAQWSFARFLLTPAAEGWFFAGGGKHWPFFLKIDTASRVGFWHLGNDEIDLRSGLIAAALAIIAARIGLWLGAWLRHVKR
jgi:hypothetical protein